MFLELAVVKWMSSDGKVIYLIDSTSEQDKIESYKQ